jgi:hypothetical protein
MSLGINGNSFNAPVHIEQAIKHASQKTGVNFDYLMRQAATESSFRAEVKASTSSATGLYQFIDQTWLAMVSQYGSKHGLGDMADKIEQDFQGRYFVSDDTLNNAILNLRKDPEISSLMAAELALQNGAIVAQKTGKDVSATDLYMAHFMGAGGASKFIAMMQEHPYRPAAHLFPSAASSNRNIFYNSDGSPKSFDQIYKHFEGKFASVTPSHPQELTASNEVQISDKGYQRDIQFERLYGQEVTHFIRQTPSIDGFQSGSLFEGLYGDKISNLVQKQVNQNALFLTLTMLDVPK